MPLDAKRARNGARRFHLARVPLAVLNRQRAELEPLFSFCDRRSRV
jgi:hypothetical protein